MKDTRSVLMKETSTKDTLKKVFLCVIDNGELPFDDESFDTVYQIVAIDMERIPQSIYKWLIEFFNKIEILELMLEEKRTTENGDLL